MSQYPIQGDPTSFEDFNHCVYLHRNKINGKVYIGQAKGDPSERWGSNGCNYRKQPCFWSAIQEFGWNNFDHIILEANLTLDQANEAEKKWISFYHANSLNHGYNKTGGGKGTYNLSAEAAQKKAESMAKYWASEEGQRQAKKHSREIQGTNNPMYGRHHTQEVKQIISEKNSGSNNGNWGKTGIRNHLSKPVYCKELDKFFGSASEADRAFKFSAGYVSKCCTGRVRSAGYAPNGLALHWRYATPEEVLRLKEELL